MEIKPQWAEMLSYVRRLHEKSTHAPRPPFQHPWEEIGPGYVSSPAFGHWDIVHQILDALPDNLEHAQQQILNDLVCQHDDGFCRARSGSKAASRHGASSPDILRCGRSRWTNGQSAPARMN